VTKLWSKGYELDDLVEAFTVGDDHILDKKLVAFDCVASMAHAKMLAKIGILTEGECNALCQGLVQIIELDQSGQFNIDKKDEDCHTAIENFLTNQLGEVGKKIHAARSRNDQVLVALRLFGKNQILEVANATLGLAKSLCDFANTNQHIPIPGRTHTQLAMPSSLGLWAGAFAESLMDDVSVLKNAYSLADQCPLGSASSYGVALPIDRQYTSDLLGFAKVQNNVLYCNNSRGKVESVVMHALVQIMNDLSKLSSDLIFFSLPELKYLTLPERFCSGSSLMPQKKNPCALELIRAKASSVSSNMMQTLDIIRPLVSGYNRDFQETKAPFMRSLETTLSSILVMQRMVEGLKVNPDKCTGAFTGELFATDYTLQLVQEGMPFREAYQKVAATIGTIPVSDPVANIASKKHLGATGNLKLDLSIQNIAKQTQWVHAEQSAWDGVLKGLIS
jgi:argininosuccinate lyase